MSIANDKNRELKVSFYGKKTYSVHHSIARKKVRKEQIPDYRDEESEDEHFDPRLKAATRQS